MKTKKTFNYLLVATLFGFSLTLNSCKKEGCTDEKATNYDEKAKKDDDSCIYPEEPTTPSEPETKTADITGLTKIGEATASSTKLEIYAKEALYPGMNKLYVVATNSSTGDLIDDGHVKFEPMMKMNSGMEHSAPVINHHEGGVDDKNLFHGNVFFVMPSTNGSWKLKVMFHNHENHSDEEATLDVTVNQNSNRMMASFVDTTTTDSNSVFLSYALDSRPTVGSNELKITAFYRKSMMDWPVANDLTIEFEPSMPSMGHGSPNNEHPAFTKDGTYVGKVNYTMTGKWRLDVTVKRNGKVIKDEVYFEYTL